MRFESFEKFLSKSFFNGNNIDLVALEEMRTIQVYLDETDEDRELHDLGDGIQAIINLMYPIFIADQGDWIMIEEPEINLHPKLQTLLLNTITSDKEIIDKKLKIFITTHSNHLIDHLLILNKEISILRFYKDQNLKDNKSVVESVISGDTSILDDLGIMNSSVFMSNCTIWVEGITDRNYIKAFLHAYIRDNKLYKFKENYHYSFIEYAGSNLSHYLFEENEDLSHDIVARFLSNRIFLIADVDEDKASKREYLESLNTNNFKYRTTGAIEIENTLSKPIVKLIFKDLKLEDASIVRMKINEVDYENVRMGTYLVAKIKDKLDKVPELKANSGTLTNYYKKKYSEMVLKLVLENKLKWDDISTNIHAKTMIEELYDFIKLQNVVDD